MAVYNKGKLIATVFNENDYYNKDESNMLINDISNVKINKLTIDEYQKMSTYDKNTLYIVLDEDEKVAYLYLGKILINTNENDGNE
jgi:hypothetical protein